MKDAKWMRRAAALILTMGMALPMIPTVGAADDKEVSHMSYADCVDTLFGLNSATSAGPTLPGGSIHPSPETTSPDCGGYSRNQPIIGFGQLYYSGTGGNKSYGNFLLAPMVGKVELNNSARASGVVSGSETGKSYEYTVTLENGIRVSTTPAHNSAIYSIDYPAGEDASFLIDVARKLGSDTAMKKGSVTVDPATNTISGGGTFSGNWNGIPWDMYFALSFDTDALEVGTFKGTTLTPAESETTVSISSVQRLGAYVKFAPSEQTRNIKVKIAISFESEARAKEFLEDQIPGYDYDAVKTAARDAWNETLGVIEVESDGETLRRFYTAMYHLNIQPRDRTSDSGNWDDIHTVWDSWRTVFPLYSLVYPEKMGSIIDSFIDRAQANIAAGNGVVLADDFSAGKEYLAGQGGNDIDNVIADAYLKNIALTKHTWEEAYEVLLASAETMRSPQYVKDGYVVNDKTTVSGVSYSGRFHPAAGTLGFAFSDFSVAQMAKVLGTKEEYEKYLDRSENWKNVWNAELESEGFYGFPQNPEADGSFAEGHNAHGGYNTHYYETTGWEASYIPYFDVSGLIEAMGGRATFVQRLLWACEHSVNYYNDDGGAEGYLNFTNEPGFHIPWLFCTDEIKRPDLAAEVVDDVLARYAKVANDYPGDEDNGGMSSYYVFMMCGFFPYAVSNDYYLHGTRLEKVTIHLDNGKDFIITGENVGGDNIYVQSATWQGKEYDACKLTYEQIMQGGELHFVMGDSASDWARYEGGATPTAVTGLTAAEDETSMGTAILRWDASADGQADVAYYDIYRSLDKTDACDETTRIGRTYTNTYTDTPILATKYYYSVVAVDEFGNRSEAKQVGVLLHYDADAPEAVSGIQVDAGMLEQGIVSLTWDEPKDNIGVVSYNVYRGTSEQELLSCENLIGVTTKRELRDIPTELGTYYYLIICRDAYGNISAPSEVLRAEVAVVSAEADATRNHALGMEVAVNGQTSAKEAGACAVDGDKTTKWCVKPDATGKHYIEIELEQSTQIGRWVVYHAGACGESAYYNTQDFSLSYWNGVSWVVIDTVTGNSASVTDRSFPAIITSKVRVDITRAIQTNIENAAGINQSNIARIYEIELYSPDAAGEDAKYADSLMHNGDVVLSVNNSVKAAEGPENVIDKNTNTKWCSRHNAETNDKSVVAPEGADAFVNGVDWLAVDLGKAYTVSRMLFVGAQGEKESFRTRELYLQWSEDGTTWNYVNGGAWKDTEDATIPNELSVALDEAVTARYFRVVIPVRGSGDGDHTRVTEFHLFSDVQTTTHTIKTEQADGAQVTPDRSEATKGDTVTLEVDYIRADREFRNVLVFGESGTPVCVERVGDSLTFRFVMPSENVTIRVYSTVMADAQEDMPDENNGQTNENDQNQGGESPRAPAGLIAAIAAGVTALATAVAVVIFKKKKEKS